MCVRVRVRVGIVQSPCNVRGLKWFGELAVVWKYETVGVKDDAMWSRRYVGMKKLGASDEG